MFYFFYIKGMQLFSKMPTYRFIYRSCPVAEKEPQEKCVFLTDFIFYFCFSLGIYTQLNHGISTLPSKTYRWQKTN